MNLWSLLFVVMGVLSALGLLYLFFRFRRFRFVYRLSLKHRALGTVIPFLCVLAVAGIILLVLRDVSFLPFNAAIMLIHLILSWLICDLIGRIIHGRFVRGKRVYWQGALALALTALYLGYGWYSAHHVVRTDYALETDKQLGAGHIRIAQISDSHVGATFHGAEFADYMREINETNPDIVVITGDYVDDETTLEDMLLCGEALEIFDAPVYWIFGNHDRGYYNYREYSERELIANLEGHGVTILRDESVYIEELNLTVVGREDRSAAMFGAGRKSAADLIKDARPDSYILVLDHEPNDYDAEAAAGADLVLCGHTHGGQLFPLGYIGLLMGSNDEFYGLSQRQNTLFIVNSGISNWSIPFKTGCIAEYTIIDISTAAVAE
ncbi:MAG: metallophosphoesterase [Clostridia bacterium]|nr:metallophosphoesterase [Clostridia bacterium]